MTGARDFAAPTSFETKARCADQQLWKARGGKLPPCKLVEYVPTDWKGTVIETLNLAYVKLELFFAAHFGKHVFGELQSGTLTSPRPETYLPPDPRITVNCGFSPAWLAAVHDLAALAALSGAAAVFLTFASLIGVR